MSAATVDRLAASAVVRVKRLLGIRRVVAGDVGDYAERLLGPGALHIVDRLACGARLCNDGDGRYHIEIEDSLPEIAFACAHEMGHWVWRVLLGLAPAVDLDEERFANSFAERLLGMPFPYTSTNGADPAREG